MRARTLSILIFTGIVLNGCAAMEGLGDICLHDEAYAQSQCLKRVQEEKEEREASRQRDEEYEVMRRENEALEAETRRVMEEHYRRESESKEKQ